MWAASAGEDEHPDPRGGPRAACIDAPGCRHLRDNHGLCPPHTPLRCPHGATLLPCATTRCYCGTAVPHDVSTMPKVASGVNIPPPCLVQPLW